MEKSLDVAAVCNALMDIVVEASEEDIRHLQLDKGHMHLVESDRQVQMLDHFKDRVQTIELGGSAMNAMRALASLGKKTAFAGMVGKDSYGLRIKERMKSLNMAAHLGESGANPTGTCLVLVSPDGERTMATCLGASRLYDRSHIPAKAVSTAKIFHFCGYQWDTPNQKEGILEAISLAKEAGTRVSFDLADPAVVQAHRDDFLKFIEHDADLVFANKEEAEGLFGLSFTETANKIASHGATAIIKLGADGAMIQQGSESIKIAPVPTTVLDTTAAGDMFAGGFLFGLVDGRPLEVCGRIAATLASDVISRYGAILSDSVLQEVRRQLAD